MDAEDVLADFRRLRDDVTQVSNRQWLEVLQRFLSIFDSTAGSTYHLTCGADLIIILLDKMDQLLMPNEATNDRIHAELLLAMFNSLRVILRGKDELSAGVVTQLMKNLLTAAATFTTALKQRQWKDKLGNRVAVAVAVAAIRCLINLTFQNEANVRVFIAPPLSGLLILGQLISSSSNSSKASSFVSTSPATAASEGSCATDAAIDDSEAQLQLCYYAVRLLNMLVSMSDSARNQLRPSYNVTEVKLVTLALVNCLDRCTYCPKKTAVLACSGSSSSSSAHGGNSINISNSIIGSGCNSSGSSSGDAVLLVSTDFPFTEERAKLFIEVSRVLFAIDVHAVLTALKSRSSSSSSSSGGSSGNSSSSSSSSSGGSSGNSSSISSGGNSSGCSGGNSSSSSGGSSSSINGSGSGGNSSGGEVDAAVDYIKRVLLFVLSGGHSSSGSGGSIIQQLCENCEHQCLQLLMHCPEDFTIALLQADATHHDAIVAAVTITTTVAATVSDAAAAMVQHIVQLLSRSLLSTQQLSDSQRAPTLTPLLIVLHQFAQASPSAKALIKSRIFPLNWTLPSGDDNLSSQRNVDPRDAPADSLRGRLVRLMTALEANLKRCSAELVFTLCDEDPDEFVGRAGFGNAVFLLQIKGLH